MGKFSETKTKILAECTKPGAKKTFNESYFNQLATAMLNDPDYEKSEFKTKNGELEKQVTTPIRDLRQSIIGSVAKAAGADKAEADKLVADHQFPTLPMYDYVESVVREYLGTGKRFPLARQENMQATFEATTVAAGIKEVRKPGETEKTKQKQGEFIKIKSRSTCPDNLKSNL